VGLRVDGNGGPLKGALNAIIESEKKPIKVLEGRKALEDTRLKLFQEFKSKFTGIDKALNEMSSFRKFRDLKAEVGDGDKLVSVTIDRDRGDPGTYTIAVNQLAGRTGVITKGYTSADQAVFGMGFITLEKPNGDNVEIFVSEDDASLNSIASMINRNDEAPVRASVIKDASGGDRPWKLLLTAKKDGEANQIHIPDFYFIDGEQDLMIDDDHPARNAELVVDGFEIESESNTITDFVKGVNLNLKQARIDNPFTLTITEDYQKIAGKMKGLVEQLNGILTFINQQNAVDERSDTRTTFAGDTGLQIVEYRIRNMLHEGFPAGDPFEDGEVPIVQLNQMGVEFEKSGMLTFKEDRFQKFMEKDFNTMALSITGPSGLATTLRELFSGYTRPQNGMLALREQGLRGRIREIDRQIELKNRNLERKQAALTAQFARMETALAGLQQQQQYMMTALPAAGGGSMVSQLMG
jgi:flagellar hook-associated protein 2